MLDAIGGKLGGLFGQAKSEHPLADAKEFRRILGELPSDNAHKALEEIAGWLESVRGADDIPGDKLFDIVRQLDDAAQWPVLRLAREYLHSHRLAKADEKKLWQAVSGFWSEAAAAYEKCVARSVQKDRVADTLRAALPMLSARLIACLGNILKWELFRYGPCSDAVWLRLGLAYSTAEQAGVATKSIQLYPKTTGTTSPQQEYLRIAVLHTSAVDSLLPGEIELAEKLVGYFLTGFVFAKESSKASVYWVDLARAQPPWRLARMPKRLVPSLRFFHPARAYDNACALVGELERGSGLPADINLGNQYHAKTVLPVVKHLAAYWAPVPPQRKHARHPVKHRMAVLSGLPNALLALSGPAGAEGLPVESWVVENVSRGGFGTLVAEPRADWLKVGSLLAMQPEGGDNWLLGIVRRYHRSSESEAQVGILTIARQTVLIAMKPRKTTGYVAAAPVQGLWIQDGNESGELRVVVPLATFDLRESMEVVIDGSPRLVAPVALVEQTGDYEIARYRF